MSAAGVAMPGSTSPPCTIWPPVITASAWTVTVCTGWPHSSPMTACAASWNAGHLTAGNGVPGTGARQPGHGSGERSGSRSPGPADHQNGARRHRPAAGPQHRTRETRQRPASSARRTTRRHWSRACNTRPLAAHRAPPIGLIMSSIAGLHGQPQRSFASPRSGTTPAVARRGAQPDASSRLIGKSPVPRYRIRLVTRPRRSGRVLDEPTRGPPGRSPTTALISRRAISSARLSSCSLTGAPLPSGRLVEPDVGRGSEP